MAKDQDKEIILDYSYLTQNALRRVIHDVLEITEQLGDVPGEHHFYIEFLTKAPGVEIADTLLENYPDRMTIVLQHSFDNLVVEEDHFEVSLKFDRTPYHLVIPFQAITKFIDPHTEFALQFEIVEMGNEEKSDEISQDEADHQDDNKISTISSTKNQLDDNNNDPDPDDDPGDDNGTSGDDGASAEILSLDKFRKK